MSQPIVAVSSDLKHFENYTWHAAPNQYLDALLKVSDALPVVVPSFGDRLDLDTLLDRVDGVMVTGSRSNVHPELYGAEATEANGPYDEARDATTLPLIRAAIAKGVPLLAICRGLQELNVALGGTLASEIQEIDGRMDHRAPASEDQAERFAIRHPVSIAQGQCLAAIYDTPQIAVNSVHRQAIDALAQGLQVEAEAPDGTIEAVSVKNSAAFALGVQWHPEYWAASDDASARIFKAFGEAVRKHAAARRP
jgi:putative glutamine amidotransferase